MLLTTLYDNNVSVLCSQLVALLPAGGKKSINAGLNPLNFN